MGKSVHLGGRRPRYRPCPTWRPHKVGTRSELAAQGLTFASREAALVTTKLWWGSDALPHRYKK